MSQPTPARMALLSRIRQTRSETNVELRANLAAHRKALTEEVAELREGAHELLSDAGKSRRAASVSGRAERLGHLKELAKSRAAPVGPEPADPPSESPSA